MRIYLAGPMFNSDGERPAAWRAKIMAAVGWHRFVCPEEAENFEDNGHNCFSPEVASQDLALLRHCDKVVAFVDSHDRIGTFCEIAAAYAWEIPVSLFYIGEAEEVFWFPWFPFALAQSKFPCASEEAAVNAIIRSFGGRPDYREYIASAEWRQKATAAKERAGNRCQLCNSADGPLDAHHRTYERLGRELPEDITVLCRPCHKKFHWVTA